MAIKLREAGRDDFVILERAEDVGGTWRDNTYPGLPLRRAVAPLLVLLRAQPGLEPHLLARSRRSGTTCAASPTTSASVPHLRLGTRGRRRGLGRGGAALADRDLAGQPHGAASWSRRRARSASPRSPTSPASSSFAGRRLPLRRAGTTTTTSPAARRRRRHRRLGDPDRPRDRSREVGRLHRLPAHAALGLPAPGRRRAAPRAAPVPPPARWPSARSARRLLGPRGLRCCRSGCTAPAAGSRSASPRRHLARPGPRPRAAGAS